MCCGPHRGSSVPCSAASFGNSAALCQHFKLVRRQLISRRREKGEGLGRRTPMVCGMFPFRRRHGRAATKPTASCMPEMGTPIPPLRPCPCSAAAMYERLACQACRGGLTQKPVCAICAALAAASACRQQDAQVLGSQLPACTPTRVFQARALPCAECCGTSIASAAAMARASQLQHAPAPDGSVLCWPQGTRRRCAARCSLAARTLHLRSWPPRRAAGRTAMWSAAGALGTCSPAAWPTALR